MPRIVIAGPQIYTESDILPCGEVTLDEGLIQAINPVSSLAPHFSFPENYHLVPGFIDLHVHGLQGADVMDGCLISLQTISQQLVAEGTTGFLATTLTEKPDKIAAALQAVSEFRAQPQLDAVCLGVHLEGPFIAPAKAGAQNAKYILPPSMTLLRQWQALSGNALRIVTLAPEVPGALEIIRALKDEKIIAALGHSQATFNEAQLGFNRGADYVTHLFNAMRELHQREPGLVTAALLAEEVYTELIVDGIHVHPAIVKMVYQLKKDKVVLITDAMRAKCCQSGIYELGGQRVTVKNGEARLDSGALAGSVLCMSDAIRNFMRMTECSLEVAIRMATVNPATILGIFSRVGSISVGKQADLVVLDDHLKVVMTFCKGVVRYASHDA